MFKSQRKRGMTESKGWIFQRDKKKRRNVL